MQNVFRYGAWDGSQHVLDLDAEALTARVAPVAR